MATELTRRRLLAAGGLTVTALTGGYALAARTTESPDGPSGWAMAQRDAAGRSFAPEADPPTDDVSVTWKQRFDTGVGFTHRNSPVVADGRVYALWEQLLVLDADSGAVQFRTDRDLSATPALAGATAYQSPTLAVTDTGGVAGLHAAGGVDLAGNRYGLTRWRRDAADDGTRMLGGTGEPVSPVAADGTVLAPGREALTALDASDGTVRWQREAGRTRPAVRDGIVYTTRFLSGVVGFDIESGERRRDIPLSDRSPWSVTATPDGLVVGTREGLLGLTADGTVRWRYEPADATDARGAVAVDEGAAYTGLEVEGTDVLVAVDTEDGTEQWRSEVNPASLSGTAPPAVAAETVYIPTGTNDLVAVNAATGEVRWRFRGEGDQALPMSPAALVGDSLYVVDSNYVYALAEA